MHPTLTVKAVLHSRKRKDGTQRVQLRITLDRISVFMDAGFTVLEKRWNPLADLGNPIWLRRSEPDFELLNTRLEKLAFRAIDLSHAYPRLTAAEVRDLLLLPSEESDDDLRRKAKQARNIRESLAKSPVVLKHYKKLVILMEHMQRELSTVKADLAKLKAAQKDSAAG